MKVLAGRVLNGPAGTATEVLVTDPTQADWTATLATWFMECPGQSPAWSHYVLSIIHLRDISDVPKAHVRVPGATHEVLLLALDPEPKPTPTKLESWRRLTPVNVMEQIELPSDESAVELLEACARAVVHGVLPAEPPFSGQVEPWRTALIKTAAHQRGEEHAP